MSTDPGAEGIPDVSDIFRNANQRIRAAAEKHAMAHAVPFLCECPEAECTDIVQLSLVEYEAVRREPTSFLQVPDHQGDADRVVSTRSGYVVTEKSGQAAQEAKGAAQS